MNLPPDKVRLLRSYDNEKKWELICDQVGALQKVSSLHVPGDDTTDGSNFKNVS